MERRKHKRHELSVVVRFDWESSGGIRDEGFGTTRDLSAAGVFVITTNPPPVGADVHFAVDLKRLGLDSTLTIEAKGTVKRVEAAHLGGLVDGFAIYARKMVLKRQEGPFE